MSTFKLVQTRELFEYVLMTASKAEDNEITTDTETSDLFKGAKTRPSLLWDGRIYCTGVGIGYDALGLEHYYYLPWRHDNGNLPPEWLPEFKEVIENATLTYHNSLFDRPSFQTLGIKTKDFFWDTLVMAQMINENFPSKELDWLCKFVLKGEGKNDEQLKLLLKGLRWHQIPPSIMYAYCCADVQITRYLKRVFLRELM